MIEYDKFKKSLQHLQVQFENYESLDNTLPVLLQEAVAESVIQRFETCYDCMWKVLKRYLISELGLAEVPNSPKPIFKLANENQLFASSVAQWLIYADTRVSTSHDYSGEKAQAALALMGDFVDDAIGLYQTMSGETWGS
jgi:nucleotidyltransferase substrate binding protein (TIGR01987 family)